MTFTITSTKERIGYNMIADVAVEADELVYAYEARAVPHGEERHRGSGINVLAEEGGYDQDGVVTLQIPSRFVYFSVSGRELGIEGEYDIYIYLRDAEGKWWPQQEAEGGSDPIIDDGDEE